MQKITPFLWFNNQAEEAMEFYTSIFPNSKIKSVARYGDAGPGPKGTVMVGSIEIGGQEFSLLNGGPQYSFSPATSFVINCDTQEEVDMYWDKLSEGGKTSQCGWLDDKFGVTWQIVPREMAALMSNPDKEKANKVMQAMLKMTKLDINELKKAAE